MRIALVGYGKMGHIIRSVAEKAGHTVALTVDVAASDADVLVAKGDGAAVSSAIASSGVDGIIEFSHPSAVMTNIEALLPMGIPLVVGTTGWADKADYVKDLAARCDGVIMHSANFSIGVNVFYRIVSEAAALIKDFDEYDTAVWEMHHNQKADSPSGTALEIAARIMKANPKKTALVTDAFHEKPQPNELHVSSTRAGSVPGTHTVFFDSAADTIELTHRARSREGFASGAVRALERLVSGVNSGTLKKGALYGMSDLFDF